MARTEMGPPANGAQESPDINSDLDHAIVGEEFSATPTYPSMVWDLDLVMLVPNPSLITPPEQETVPGSVTNDQGDPLAAANAASIAPNITPVTRDLDASVDAPAVDGEILVEGPGVDNVASASAPANEAIDVSPDMVVDDENLGPDPVDEAVKRLAGLSPHEYDRARKNEAKALGLRIPILDEAVKQAQAAQRQALGNGNAVSFPAVEPWDEPMELAQVLDEIQETIRRFIVCDIETSVAAALWIAFTWFIDHVQIAPIAAIVSPRPRCGKTQFLDVLSRLSRRPLPASHISPAAVFRVIQAHSPTLLIDEADTFLKDNEPMRNVLNSGHTRQSAFVIRVDGDPSAISQFSTWSAKAIASIGHLPGTIMDRSIELPLKRKLPSENVQRLRHADPAQFNTLVRKLARLAEDIGPTIAQARPDLPPELNDRAQDNWEPLLAVANLAGGQWPQKARVAALKLSGADHEAMSPSTELLADIKEAFGLKDRISTADLLAALVREEPGPRGRSGGGRPNSPSQLATRLKEFKIHSMDLKFPGNRALKGFRLAQFQDAFDRYLTPPAGGAGPATPQLSNGDADL